MKRRSRQGPGLGLRRLWWRKGERGGGQLVICNGGMWGRVGGAEYSLSHWSKRKRRGRGGREGPGGWASFLRGWRGGRRAPVAYFQFLETPGKLNLLKVTLLNKLLANASRAQSTHSPKSIMTDLVN